jgi:hypothetical protein
MSDVLSPQQVHARLVALARPVVPELCVKHPRVDDDTLERQTLAWVERFAYLGRTRDSMRRWRFSTLTSTMFAGCSEAGVQLINDVSLWIFALDDLAESHNGMLAPALQGLGTHSGAGMFHDAWCELRARITKGSSRDLSLRVDLEVERLLGGNEWEAQMRARGELASCATLEEMRHLAGATGLYAALLERDAGGLSLREVASERFRTSTRLAGQIACFYNDLFSTSHDATIGNPHNIANARARERGTSIEIARAHLASDLEQGFQALLMHVASGMQCDEANARRYYAGLPSFAMGCVYWHATTQRYAPTHA